MTKLKSESRFLHHLPDAFIGFSMVSALAVSSAWNKPLWIDEVLHFALGGMTFREVIQTIDYTTIEINHGQTGVYMLADWGLLQVFGANALALRFPSILAAFVLMWSAIVFLRHRKLNHFWQWLSIPAFAGSAMWAAYVGEARPYMPLAASAIALVTFYTATPDQRSTLPTKAIGFTGLVIGASMHPYWIYFLFMTVAFGLFFARWNRSWPVSWRSLWQYLGKWLFVAATAVFVIIGQLTWMRWVRKFAYDPFQWFESPGSALTSLIRNHIYGDFPVLWVILAISLLIVIPFLKPTKNIRALIPPLLLLLFGIGSTLIISFASYARNYWIVERQWIAGISLAILALVWLFAELWRQSAGSRLNWKKWPSLLFVLIVLVSAFTTTRATLHDWTAWRTQQVEYQSETRTPEQILAELNDQTIVYGANVNTARGGPIWPQFFDWYRNQAGMRPEFRELNPSWSR